MNLENSNTLDDYIEVNAFIQYSQRLLKEFKKSYGINDANKLHASLKVLQLKYFQYFTKEIKLSLDLIICIFLLCEVGGYDIISDELIQLTNLLTKIEIDCSKKVLQKCRTNNINYEEVIKEINLRVQELLLHDNFE